MKLKAIILATGLINCIAFSAQAVDSTITVTGNVLQRSCTIGGAGGPNQTVSLGDLYTSDLITNGSTSAWKIFKIEMTNCQNMSTVRATFSGSADNTDYYANAGTASNIMIELQDQSGQNIRYKPGSVKTVNVDTNTRRASFDLKVRAVSKGNAGAGSISSQITVTYTYA